MPCSRPAASCSRAIPNFGHWYPRGRVALGRFDYDRRGILDRGHVRFFTRRSFERLVASAGWDIRRQESIGLPFEVADRGASSARRGRAAVHRPRRADQSLVGMRPQLFAYQFLYELAPTP